MEPEEQVCSQPLAERLCDLGVKQASWHYWRLPSKEDGWELWDKAPQTDSWRCYSAFTVAELLHDLPQSMRRSDSTLCAGQSVSDLVLMHSSGDGYRAFYMCRGCGHPVENMKSDQLQNPANALADLRIRLIENGLITTCV